MTATEKPNLTLYGIETQLLELLNFRDSIESDPDMTPQEQAESLKACDESIAEYIRAEVKKCDGIAGYLREFEARAATLKAEADRCYEMAKVWEKRHDSLEQMVIDVMRAMKKDRIDGRLNVLKLAKNPASANIIQPELVPAEYQRYELTITGTVLQVIVDAMAKDHKLLSVYGVEPKGEPAKSIILKRLKEGDGVPGCRLRTDSVRLEVK